MKVQVIGDEIHYDGYLVAIIAQGAPATVCGAFTDDLNGGGLTTREDAELLDSVLDEARKKARGGLLSINDLATIVASHK